MGSDNKAVVQRWFDAINRHDLEGVGAPVADGARWRVPVMDEPLEGPEAVRQLVGGFIAAFPDLHIDVEWQAADGDRVVTKVVASGTNDGELLGMPPTGKRVSWDVVHMHTVREGQLVDDHVIFDRVDLMQKLGLMPEPAQAMA